MLWVVVIVLLLAPTAFTWAACRLMLAGALEIGGGRIAIYAKEFDARSPKAAYSVWMPGLQAVVLNTRYVREASREQIRYVMAHEVGHLRLGHARRHFLRACAGYGLVVRASQATLERFEQEADAYASAVTGMSRCSTSPQT